MSSLQTNNYIATFFTHSGAIKYSRFLKYRGIDNTMKPVPRSISSSCGICVEFSCEGLSGIVSTDIYSIYEIKDGSMKKIYECE